MYTADVLVDIHERAHRGFARVLEHCGQFSADDLEREIPGFGYGSLQLQFHHAIGAERYWIGVLQSRIDADDDAEMFPTVSALQGFRSQVFKATNDYLGPLSAADLNEARAMMTWGNREQDLIPAHVVLRTQTHLFHHQGQIAAMCRILGKPSPSADYPIV